MAESMYKEVERYKNQIYKIVKNIQKINIRNINTALDVLYDAVYTAKGVSEELDAIANQIERQSGQETSDSNELHHVADLLSDWKNTMKDIAYEIEDLNKKISNLEGEIEEIQDKLNDDELNEDEQEQLKQEAEEKLQEREDCIRGIFEGLNTALSEIPF